MQNLLKQFVGKDSVSFDKRLSRSLIFLTFLYSLILGVILFISASITYSAFNSRIGVRFNRFPNSLVIPLPERRGPTMEELRQDLLNSIILVNGYMFIVAIGLSYVLAKVTLRPLKEAYDDQRRFIADASHELRTPLAVMNMELENELARNSLSKQDKERIESHLEEVRRMKKIVQDLLLLSKLENLNDTAVIIPTDINQALKDVIKRLAPLSESHNVAVIFNPAKTELFVKGNEQIPNVLMNVIQNAITYNKSSGKVTVSVEEKDSRVLATVADTGVGISKDDLKHVFDRFYRADKSRSRSSGGSGLGLSIVKRGIESVGGTISIQSVVDKGTTIVLSFEKSSNFTITS